MDFDDAGDYRTHCRSDWHNFNLKRKHGWKIISGGGDAGFVRDVGVWCRNGESCKVA